jgi:hypothetical protein
MPALAVLAALVASIVGHPVPVSCPAPEVWASDAAVAADTALYGFEPAAYTALASSGAQIVLGPTACTYASLLATQPSSDDPQAEFVEGEALLLVLHESEHASGWAGESDAECRAIARVPEAAAFLGVTGRHAQALEAGALAYHLSMPAYYRTGCEQLDVAATVPARQRGPVRAV